MMYGIISVLLRMGVDSVQVQVTSVLIKQAAAQEK